MGNTPSYLQDAKDILTTGGFSTSDAWYHGTSTALLSSIAEQGLKRSGDTALNQAAKNTMATINGTHVDITEPVFLTQSKELAYYWAQQTVRRRLVRFDGDEEAVVFAVKLPVNELSNIKPDVGAASLLLTVDGEKYIAHVAHIYQANGFEMPDIDIMKAARMDYLNILGMAYLNQDVEAQFVRLIKR